MVRKLIRIGNSNGVTLDKKMLQSVGLDGASYIWIEPNKEKTKIMIRKRAPTDW